jgi:hypothetical protein
LEGTEWQKPFSNTLSCIRDIYVGEQWSNCYGGTFMS